MTLLGLEIQVSSSPLLVLAFVGILASVARSELLVCNTTCEYQQTVWSVLSYSETEIPQAMWERDVAAAISLDTLRHEVASEYKTVRQSLK